MNETKTNQILQPVARLQDFEVFVISHSTFQSSKFLCGVGDESINRLTSLLKKEKLYRSETYPLIRKHNDKFNVRIKFPNTKPEILHTYKLDVVACRYKFDDSAGICLICVNDELEPFEQVDNANSLGVDLDSLDLEELLEF